MERREDESYSFQERKDEGVSRPQGGHNSVASRTLPMREDFEDDSPSSSINEVVRWPPPMILGKKDSDLLPYEISRSWKWLRYLAKWGHDFSCFLLLLPGFSFRYPTERSKVDRLSASEIVVYIDAFRLGLRFPLHPFVLDVFRGYDIVWPN